MFEKYIRNEMALLNHRGQHWLKTRGATCKGTRQVK
jgi:hypothetical protein